MNENNNMKIEKELKSSIRVARILFLLNIFISILIASSTLNNRINADKREIDFADEQAEMLGENPTKEEIIEAFEITNIHLVFNVLGHRILFKQIIALILVQFITCFLYFILAMKANKYIKSTKETNTPA